MFLALVIITNVWNLLSDDADPLPNDNEPHLFFLPVKVSEWP